MSIATKVAATIFIGAGGALAGVLGGWNLGPVTVELSREQLSLVGALGGALLALTGSCCAIEYAQARDQNEKHLVRLKRLAALTQPALSTVRFEKRVDCDR